MRRMTMALVMTVSAAAGLMAGQAPDAAKVLAEMQGAIGDAEKVASVRTLTAKGMIQRVTPAGTVEREVAIAMALPDKYVVRTQLTAQGNMSVHRNAGFTGETLINETEAPPNLAAAGRNRLAMSDRVAMTPEQQESANVRLLQNGKRDFARFALAMLGTSFEALPLQFSYVGQAQAPDGTAHVVGARGADAFDARLFIDTATHRPLMLTWSEPLPRDSQTMQEFRLYYSNFRTVDGLALPHTIRRSVDGNVTEETTFSEIRINPTIDPKTFEVPK